MHVTIVVEDNIVIVDGKWRKVDCSPLFKDGIRAVQWHEALGEIEFRTEFDAENKMLARQPNETITKFSPYQSYVDQWKIENAKQELIDAAQQKEVADNEQAAAKQRRLHEAWMRLPLVVQEQLFAAQREQRGALEERAALADQRRLEEWLKLSPDEQQQVIADASS
jgi:hypothetical protein